MPEYVTKEAVKQAMRSQPRGVLFTEWELDRVPTVDAEEVVHGEWIETGYIFVSACSCCNKCSRTPYYAEGFYNYCPNCGAKMDGEGST